MGLARFLAEPPGGENHGRRRRLADEEEGEKESQGPYHSELGADGAVRIDHLAAGGWHKDRPGPTGNPVGRPPVVLDLTADQEALLVDYVGVTPEQFRTLFRRGRPSADMAAERAWVEDRFHALLSAEPGSHVGLALRSVYGLARRTVYDMAARGAARANPHRNP